MYESEAVTPKDIISSPAWFIANRVVAVKMPFINRPDSPAVFATGLIKRIRENHSVTIGVDFETPDYDNTEIPHPNEIEYHTKLAEFLENYKIETDDTGFYSYYQVYPEHDDVDIEKLKSNYKDDPSIQIVRMETENMYLISRRCEIFIPVPNYTGF